jgi:putative drug exporter of the RND superfamily
MTPRRSIRRRATQRHTTQQHATQRRNLAASLGGWSTRHRKTAIFGWLLFVLAASLLGSAAGQVGLTSFQQGAGDSARAEQIISRAGISQPAQEAVLIRSDSVTAGSASFHGAVRAVLTGVRSTGLARNIQDPYGNQLVSADGHDALVRFNVTSGAANSSAGVQPLLTAVARAHAASPGFTMKEFGDASGAQGLNDTLGANFSHAEWTAVPLALGILLIAFGALTAAVLPVLLALTAFAAALGLLDLVSHVVGVNSYTNSVMLLMGLAVGVDYCIFYLRREREERAAGRDSRAALRVAAATSGRSVLVSGLIVMAGMAGMLLSGMSTFEGFGLAVILVVGVAMAGSVTVLPAVISLLGDRVAFGQVPFLARRRRPAAGGGRVTAALGRAVTRRPWIFALLSATVLLGLAAPAAGMHTETLSIGQLLPYNSTLATASRQIATAFPGTPAPAQIVIKAADIQAPRLRQAITSFETAALRSGALRRPVQLSVYRAANVAEIVAPLAGNGSDAASQRALTALRREVIPPTLGRVPGTQALVGGDLASSVDYNDQLRHAIVAVGAFVMIAAFVLMLISLGSVVIAATAILLDLLSVAAAYGVMTAVFVRGWGAGLVGTHPVGAIESWIPLFVFVILFGLSMDYHVFVVSRIREAHEAGMPTRRAVSHGVAATAGVVTSAAAIMVAVFAVFGMLSMQDFKQLGVGLATAILLDATVIRVLLLPSVMTLLGERNWYLPRWLSWLPRISVDGTPGCAEAGQAAADPVHAGAP